MITVPVKLNTQENHALQSVLTQEEASRTLENVLVAVTPDNGFINRTGGNSGTDGQWYYSPGMPAIMYSAMLSAKTEK